MAKDSFAIELLPLEALDFLKEKMIEPKLVHDERHDLGNGRSMGILVFEQYFWRAGNRVALVVVADNLKGQTEVRVIATGSSRALLLNIDWGAAEAFVDSVKRVLEEHMRS